MEKEWTKHPRFSKEYINGVEYFLDIAYSSRGRPQGQEILCPCASCRNLYWARRDVVYDHLIAMGFVRGYNVWVFHGEKIPSRSRAEKAHREKVARTEMLITTRQGHPSRKRKAVDEDTLDDAISKIQSSIRNPSKSGKQTFRRNGRTMKSKN